MSEQGSAGINLPSEFDQARMDRSLERELELDAENWPELDDHLDLEDVYPSPGGALEEAVHRQVSGRVREEYSREVHGDLSRLEDERELDFDEQFAEAARGDDVRDERGVSGEFHELAESDLTRAELDELTGRGDWEQSLRARFRDADRDEGPEH